MKGDDRTVPQLWTVMQHMISQMAVPLVQLLIDALFLENLEKVKLYTLAVVQQTAQCHPSDYKCLKEELLGSSVAFDRKAEIITGLEEVYNCLGFTCAHIGTYKQGQIPQCEDKGENYPLAKYFPTTRVYSVRYKSCELDTLYLFSKADTFHSSLFRYTAGNDQFGLHWERSHLQNIYLYGQNSPLPVESALNSYEL